MDNYSNYNFDKREDILESDMDQEIISGSGCTECSCNYFSPDLDADLTGFTCKCGHMKSAHWR